MQRDRFSPTIRVFAILIGVGLAVTTRANDLTFDGVDDYVRVPHAASQDPGTGSFTFETRFRMDRCTGPSFCRMINKWAGLIGRQDAYSVHAFTNGLVGGILRDVSGTTQGLISSSPLDDGEWHHVALVRDVPGGRAKLYVDGVLDVDEPLTATGRIEPAVDLSLGGFIHSVGIIQHFEGSMDEVRLWNEARTASEIQDHHDVELPAPQPNLVLYYTFNQGVCAGLNPTETTVFDQASSGQDGSLIDFALAGCRSNWTCSGPSCTGLRAHYEFADDTTEADLGFNSSTGVADPLAGSGALTQVPGPGGSLPTGADFGSSAVHRRIDVAGAHEIGDGAFTATAWVRTTASEQIRTIVWGSNATDTGIGTDTVTLYLQFGEAVAFLRERPGNPDDAVVDNVALNDGEWHFVAFSWTGGNDDVLSLYVDCRLAGRLDVARGFLSNTDWSVGSRFNVGPTDFSWDGELADVRIYDRALSDGGVAVGGEPGGDLGELFALGPPPADCVNRPPTAACSGGSFPVDTTCTARVHVDDIDAGASDPDGAGDIDTLCITAVDGVPVPCLDSVDFIDDLGSHVVTLTITDLAGEFDSCDATVEVVDLLPPVLSGVPEDIIVSCDAVPPQATVAADDNCDGAVPVTPTEDRTDGPCADTYTVTRRWTARDGSGNVAGAMQTVTVQDLSGPTVTAQLTPAVPLPPSSANSVRSACTPTSIRLFEVVCRVSDNCDPSPSISATLFSFDHDVGQFGDCTERVDATAVACGDLVEIRLLAPACPSKPQSARFAASVNSDGVLVVTAARVELEVEAQDRCGNASAARFDPAREPSTHCDDVLPDGTCCPAIAAPEARCQVDPCAFASGAASGVARLAPAVEVERVERRPGASARRYHRSRR